MIPVRDVVTRVQIPKHYQYWTPSADDIDEEGFGFFRGVWPLFATKDDAQAVIADEAKALAILDATSANETEFEANAKAIETYDSDFDDAHGITAMLPVQWGGFDGLEVGVAGLAFALASNGCFPAASCRSHVASSWSDTPVVIFAGSGERVSRLVPLIQASGCGIGACASRTELLEIYAASVTALSHLATEVVELWSS